MISLYLTQLKAIMMSLSLAAKRLMLLFFLLSIHFGCSHSPQHSGKINFPVKPLKILGEEDEGGGADIRLSITSINETDSAKIFQVASSYKGKDLGFTLFVPKETGDSKGFGKGIVLKSAGTISDNLLGLLTTLYHLKPNAGPRFVNAVSVGYVDLGVFATSIGGTAANTEMNTAEYKLFFESKNDEAELYLNINEKEHWIELSEKDAEYRPMIITMLSK